MYLTMDQRIHMPVEQKNHSGPTSMQHHRTGMNLGLSAPQKSFYIAGELKKKNKNNNESGRSKKILTYVMSMESFTDYRNPLFFFFFFFWSISEVQLKFTGVKSFKVDA